MRLRKKEWAKPLIKEQTDKIVISKLDFLTSNIKKSFKNNKKLILEIGVGRGDFICEMALLNDDSNFIGIEQSETALAIALRKIVDKEIKNVKLILVDAREMLNIFNSKEIDVIRLNFSDPWPKARHEGRRLTSFAFLEMYKRILNDDGKIVFKTDNRDLFDYSVESFKENGFKIETVNYDYPLTFNKDDVPTEYEKKFRNLNQKIFYMSVNK